jgi:hypothetical protein
VYPVEATGLLHIPENAEYGLDKGFTNRVRIEVTVALRPQSEGPEEELARKAIPSALRDQVPPDLGGPTDLKATI